MSIFLNRLPCGVPVSDACAGITQRSAEDQKPCTGEGSEKLLRAMLLQAFYSILLV
jgi:hypothetical protein